jgi:tetratricopeptide (TPR) repeat protein
MLAMKWDELRLVLGACCLLIGISSAFAQEAEVDHRVEYGACLALAEDDPAQAYRSGLAWFKAGGGLPARHCVAVALVGLGDHEAAATRFETLADELSLDRADLRAAMLGHAGQAWLLAGRPVRASQVQDAAISLNPNDPSLFVDRAVSLMTNQQYARAIGDLNKALALEPDFADAYLYRATAKRYVNDIGGAWVDINDALALAPGLPAALLERGILRRLDGDLEGARNDWQTVIAAAGESAEAAAARARIEAMDVRQ